jgi:hypothetical protein
VLMPTLGSGLSFVEATIIRFILLSLSLSVAPALR